MKTILSFFLVLSALNSFAGVTNVDVISSEFGVEDNAQNKTLCLTVVRVPANGKLLGVVEEIEDCFYARKAKKQAQIELDIKALKVVPRGQFLQHLQSLDTQLKFYFSPGE